MTLIRDVLNMTRVSLREAAELAYIDSLTANGPLQNAQLLDVRLDATRVQVGLLYAVAGAEHGRSCGA